MARLRVATAALALLFTACGGTGPEPAAEDPAAAQAGPEAAYRAWLSALAARDAAAACDRHAPDFTIELRQRAILAQRASLGDPCEDFVAVLWEDPATETDPVGIETTQQTEEDALLAVDFPEVDRTVRMIQRHGGQWYVDSTTPREEGESSNAWVGVWCDLDISMSREEIVDRMGEPSGEYTVSNGGEPQLWWANGPYDFRAYLEPDGSVAELVGDYDALTSADTAQLHCPELRNRTNS